MDDKFGNKLANGLLETPDFVIADEKAFCELDVRLGYSEITIEDGAGLAGKLPLISIDDLGAFTPAYQAQLGVSGITGRALLIGGGLAQFRAGVWTRAKDRQGRAATVTAMVTQALHQARQTQSRPLGLFVEDEDIDAFTAAIGPSPAPQRRYGWCTLQLNGGRTLDEFFSSQPRKSRQTWRRDQRDGEQLGLSYETVAFDDETTRQAAPMIAEVSRRNGLPEHHQLTRWRMGAYKHRPGQSCYLRTSNDQGVVAYTACRTWGTTLQAHTVGIDPAVSDRRSVYHYAAYLAPLAAALAQGWSQVEYGIAHEQPKLARGCDAVTVWQIDFGPGRQEA
jgi:hypothetical protein